MSNSSWIASSSVYRLGLHIDKTYSRDLLTTAEAGLTCGSFLDCIEVLYTRWFADSGLALTVYAYVLIEETYRDGSIGFMPMDYDKVCTLQWV